MDTMDKKSATFHQFMIVLLLCWNSEHENYDFDIVSSAIQMRCFFKNPKSTEEWIQSQTVKSAAPNIHQKKLPALQKSP